MDEIIFAQTADKAIHTSEAYGISGESTRLKSRRVPEFDQYAEQENIPADVMVKQGWLFKCETCSALTDARGVVKDNKIYCEDCKEKIHNSEGCERAVLD